MLLPRVNRPMPNLVRIRLDRVFPSYPFVSTVKILKEGRQLHHDAFRHRNENINAMDRPLQVEHQDREDPLEIRKQNPPAYSTS